MMFLGNMVLADDTKQDLIDAEEARMIEKDPSTAGMVNATIHATELWDAEMNRVYVKLMAKLPGNEREVLKKSQLAWLAYRDANQGLVGTVYDHLQGTMYRPMRCSEREELIKDRTLLLRSYLDLLNEAEDNSK